MAKQKAHGVLQTSEAVVQQASQAASGDERFVGLAVSAMINALQRQLSSRKRAAPDSAQQAEARPAEFDDLTMTAFMRMAATYFKDHAPASGKASAAAGSAHGGAEEARATRS